jgi:hypothetical protein
MDQNYLGVVAQSLFAYQSAVVELRVRAEDLHARIAKCAAAVQQLYATILRSSELPACRTDVLAAGSRHTLQFFMNSSLMT